MESGLERNGYNARNDDFPFCLHAAYLHPTLLDSMDMFDLQVSSGKS